MNVCSASRVEVDFSGIVFGIVVVMDFVYYTCVTRVTLLPESPSLTLCVDGRSLAR
jgi:hypothetical protein